MVGFGFPQVLSRDNRISLRSILKVAGERPEIEIETANQEGDILRRRGRETGKGIETGRGIERGAIIGTEITGIRRKRSRRVGGRRTSLLRVLEELLLAY